MKSTTRYSSALALWFLSMTIFIIIVSITKPLQQVSAFHQHTTTTYTKNSPQQMQRYHPHAIQRRALVSRITTSRRRHNALFALSSTDLRQDSSQHNHNNDVDNIINQEEDRSNNNSSIHPRTSSTSVTASPAIHNHFLIQSIQNSVNSVNSFTKNSKRALQVRKRDWIEKSTAYYSTVMRNESRRARGQIKPSQNTLDNHRRNLVMAKKLYFARNKIKTGALNHAETIYRKLIDELIQEEEDEEECDHAQLAISTLLLALLLQRKNQITETRKVFNRFFTIIHSRNQTEGGDAECACSAKVLQAYALFEMKQGHVRKAYRLAQMAVKLDSELHPLLKWKQFRDAKELSIMKGWNSI